MEARRKVIEELEKMYTCVLCLSFPFFPTKLICILPLLHHPLGGYTRRRRIMNPGLHCARAPETSWSLCLNPNGAHRLIYHYSLSLGLY